MTRKPIVIMNALATLILAGGLCGCATTPVDILEPGHRIVVLSMLGDSLPIDTERGWSRVEDVSAWQIDAFVEQGVTQIIEEGGRHVVVSGDPGPVRLEVSRAVMMSDTGVLKLGETHTPGWPSESLARFARASGADSVLLVVPACTQHMDTFLTGYGVSQEVVYASMMAKNYAAISLVLIDGETGVRSVRKPHYNPQFRCSKRSKALWIRKDKPLSEKNYEQTRQAIVSLLAELLRESLWQLNLTPHET